MNLLIASFLTFFSLLQTGFDRQIADQTSEYLSNISEGVDLSENYWSLNELYSSTCTINSFVIREIISSNVQEAKPYFSNSRCDNSFSGIDNKPYQISRNRSISLDYGLLGLGVYYLLTETNLERRNEFYNSFQEKWGDSFSEMELRFLRDVSLGNTLIVEQIPEKERELIFYSFLYTYSFGTYFPDIQSEVLLSEWISNYESNYPEQSVRRSIQIANIVFLSFNINAYPTVERFLPAIIDNGSFPVSFERTRHLNATRYSVYVLGRLDQSLQIIRNQLLPLTDYLNMTDLNDETTLNQATILFSLGKFRAAKEIFEELYNDSSSNVEKTELLNNLSICHLKLGEKNKYINYQLKALEEAELNDSYINELIVLRNLFIFYTSIRDDNNALYYLTRAEEIAIEENDIYELASIHAFSATFQWEFNKDAEAALRELDLALEQFDLSTDYFDFIEAKSEQAMILTSIDSLEQAKKVYIEIRDIARERSISSDYLEALIGLTEIALKQSDIYEASRILDEIRIYPLTDLDFSTSVKFNTVKAWYQKETGNVRTSFEEFLPIIKQITDRARNFIDTQSGTWELESEYIQAYNLVTSMLLELGNHPMAIELLDELKTINDAALYNSPILRAQRLSEEELAKDQLLSNEIQQLRNDYLNTSSEAQRFQINQDIESLSAQREEILSRIRTNLTLDQTSVWKAQRRLGKDEMIIHYTEIGDLLYAGYITQNTAHVRALPFDAEKKQVFTEAANKLASSRTDLNLLYEVFDHLELRDQIPENIKDLTIIPDNYLYRIPLGVLPTQPPASSTSYGSTSYFLEDYGIKYFTSLNEFLENNRNQGTKAEIDFSAYALSDFSSFEQSNLPALPYTTQEVRDIDDQLERFEKRNIYLENEATKDSFINGIQNSRIVHVATHSEVSEQDPLFSTIYLKSDGNQQSALYAYELFDATINSDLIMLNSCSSGSGGYLQGSGVVGISRALRYAGAKSLALNIWSVNDKSAAEFATGFYESIDEGSPKWAAMRDAKLQLLKSGNANPYYWGAYMLIGNPSPLTKKPANAGFLYLILATATIALSVTVMNRSVVYWS